MAVRAARSLGRVLSRLTSSAPPAQALAPASLGDSAVSSSFLSSVPSPHREMSHAEAPPQSDPALSTPTTTSVHSQEVRPNLSCLTSGPPRNSPLLAHSRAQIRVFSGRADVPPEPTESSSSAAVEDEGGGRPAAGGEAEAELSVEFLEELVRSTEEAFGNDHQFTATTNLKLAQAYSREGQEGEKVLAAAQKAWTWFDQHAEKDNLVRVMCLHLLASASTRMGRPEDSLRYLETSLQVPASSQAEGEHAMMLFASHMMIGDNWAIMGGQQQACASYRTALTIQEKALGPHDERVGDTCRHLAEAHAQLMEFEEAEPLARRALELHLRHGGEGTLNEAIDRRLLAAIYAGLEEPQRALAHLEATRSIVAERRQGLDAALTDVAIGDMLVAMGKPEEAVGPFEGALRVQKAVLGEAHPTVAATYASAADAYLKAGDPIKAESVCEKALKIYEKDIGEDSLETANGLTELAHIYEALEKPVVAVDLLRRALLSRLDVPGQLLAAAGTESNLGMLLLSLGHHKEALQALDSCLAKLEATYEDDHPSMARVLASMATAVVRGGGAVGTTEDALALLERAQSVVDRAGLGGSLEGVEVYEGLVPLLHRAGRLEEAVRCQEQVVQVKEGSLGARHPEVVKAKEALEQLKTAESS